MASSPPAASGHRIEVHGHRGARARFPENTLPAFAHALQQGVDWIELDLVVTADDALAVMHDPVLNPLICSRADGSAAPDGWLVREHTLAELQAFDCGRLRHPRFAQQQTVPGTPVPTLDEVIALVERSPSPTSRSVQLNVELKLVPGLPRQAPTPERFAALAVDCLRRHGMVQRSQIQSFDHRALAAVRKLEPALRLAALVDETHPDLVALARAVGAGTVAPHQRWLTAEDVAALHRARIRVVPWTVNDAADWQRLADWGVDGIISDDPAALIAFLRQRGLR
ncbi:MAG: glycerophosphodiester phosphodiesterase [Deltaproteobacteria bacterium]|nr:glycerophosphodiester phosphodiesterase [Deltaproteobacteria bacterium]